MTLTQPTIYDLATDYARFGLVQWQANEVRSHYFTNRFNQGVQGRPEFIVLHIQDGITPGSLEYWVGVDASSTVMAQRDGSILKVIPEQHGPWTNGDVMSPKPEAAELIAKPGNKNLWSLTVEAEGRPFDPMPQVQINSIAWQCLDWMQRYPHITIDRILRHGWINSVSRANCGLYIDQVKAVIAQEIGNVPADTSKYPDGMDEGVARMLFGKVIGDDGKSYAFNPDGRVSNRWLERGKSENAWPELIRVRIFDDRKYFDFSDGWVLWQVGSGALKEL